MGKVHAVAVTSVSETQTRLLTPTASSAGLNFGEVDSLCHWRSLESLDLS